MTSNLIRLALGLVFVTFGFQPFEQAAAQPAPAGAREVPARLLPVPDTVSPQMQAIIARPVDPAKFLAPQTTAEWKKRVEDGERTVEATLPKIRAALGVTVEPTVIGGVRCFTVTPKSIPPNNRNRILLHFHSGGRVSNPGEAGTREAIFPISHFQPHWMMLLRYTGNC